LAEVKAGINMHTVRGYSIKESGFGYIVHLDSDSLGKWNTTVT